MTINVFCEISKRWHLVLLGDTCSNMTKREMKALDFDHPGVLQPNGPVSTTRRRLAVRHLLPVVTTAQIYPAFPVEIRFVGESQVEIRVTIDPIEEAPIEEEYKLDTRKCPSCRGKMDFDLAVSCIADCAVCLNRQVECFISCVTMNDSHALCKANCHARWAYNK